MAHFTQSDLQVGEKTEKYYGILAAENGFGVSINGIDVEVYQFNTSIGSGQKALDAIIKEGLMGSPVYKNGDLILVENKSHPKWNEILSSFQSY
ncbi:MAG: hypothetical protein JWM56_110 [Candidatus Peribacteria bacterium]|nr:hypothetical protein [Candidatus Peribacteria bacterium]